jgi:hypothetical protein
MYCRLKYADFQGKRYPANNQREEPLRFHMTSYPTSFQLGVQLMVTQLREAGLRGTPKSYLEAMKNLLGGGFSTLKDFGGRLNKDTPFGR